MKKVKLFLCGIAAVMIVAVATLNVSLTPQSENLSDIVLVNVEALASESTPSCTGPKDGDCKCTLTTPCKDLTGCN
jgi:hypothetical protein